MTPANWSNPAFAADGTRLAIDILRGDNLDIWVYDWMRDTMSRLTFGAEYDGRPVWSPDGRRLAFTSTRRDSRSGRLYWQRADGTGEAQPLTTSEGRLQYAGSFHPSGKVLAFTQSNETADILMLPFEGSDADGWKPGAPTVFLNGDYTEGEPMFSPDGRWLAYVSFESGRSEVYVRPFPGPGGKWQISTDGGTYPTWSRARAELFYATPDQRIMVVSYTANGESFRAEKPRLWSGAPFLPRPRGRPFDLHRDGSRVAVEPVPEGAGGGAQARPILVSGFFDELRRLAPAR